MQLRQARPGDADAIARAHVRAWQAAYRGQMPDALLDELTVAQRRQMWTRVLDRYPERVRVVEEAEVVGFAYVGPARHADAAVDEGELVAINLDPAVWGRGLGRTLLADAEACLAAMGFRTACLWVLAGNERARRLYHAAGWRPDGARKVVDLGGAPVDEVRYVKPLAG